MFLLSLSVEVDAVVVHHHDELPQVQLPVVVHVYPGHQTVDLGMGWIPTKSSQQGTKLPGANITAVVLTHQRMSLCQNVIIEMFTLSNSLKTSLI